MVLDGLNEFGNAAEAAPPNPLVVIELNHRSAVCNQAELVGMKWEWKRLCFSSHATMSGCWRMAQLSKMTWISLPEGVLD